MVVVVVVCVVIIVCGGVVVVELVCFSLLMLVGVGDLGEVIHLLGLAWFVFVLVVWFGFSLLDV